MILAGTELPVCILEMTGLSMSLRTSSLPSDGRRVPIPNSPTVESLLSESYFSLSRSSLQLIFSSLMLPSPIVLCEGCKSCDDDIVLGRKVHPSYILESFRVVDNRSFSR